MSEKTKQMSFEMPKSVTEGEGEEEERLCLNRDIPGI
jgi:hypothetical protein